MSTATIVNVSTGEIISRELTEKASANTKLKALGLTDAEIAALVS